MMTWLSAVWMVFGAAIGVLHAAGVWRSASRPSVMSALLGLVRLVVVGLALVASAILGGILPAAAGWALGYFAAVAFLSTRRRRTSQRRPAP